MESVEGNGTGRGNLQLVVSELCRVQELVRQLELHLHAPDASIDLCRALTAEIFALTDRSIGFVAAAHFPDAPTTPSSTSSSLSGVSDQPFRTNTKKRKATTRWTSQVRVSAAGGAEWPGDDGHSWRKYGQKDILGARHPRAYYRCTHRNSQGCPATKQVQRADQDPALFDIVYHGQHTCRPGGGGGGRRPPTNHHNPHAESLLQSLRAGLTVDADHGALNNTSVSPPSMASPVESGSNGGLTMSPYPVPAGAYTEWPLDGDLQEVVSALTAVSAPSMDCLFEFDPTFGLGAPNFFM